MSCCSTHFIYLFFLINTNNNYKFVEGDYASVWEARFACFSAEWFFPVSFGYCSQNP